MNATEAAALQVGQRIQWSDHHIDEVVLNDGAVITVKRGPGYAEMKVPPALPPRGLQPVTMTFAYAALADAGLAFANPSLTEDAPVDGKFYARDGKNGKWVDVSGGVAPPTIDAGRGLTMTGNTIDLDPAQPLPGEIGGINEAPSDGTPYVRQDVGWVPAAAAVVPPATDTVLGIITEPAPDGQDYVRTWNATQWVWEVATSSVDFGTGLNLDDTTVPPIVHLDPAGPTNLGGVTVPVRTAAQGLTIDMGNVALNDPATGLLTLETATNGLLGGMLEPLPDGIAYARKFDTTLVPPAWVWVPTTAAGLQITSVIPNKCMIDAVAPDITVNAYGAEFTPTCVIMIDGVAAPTTPDTATHCTFTVDPGLHPAYHAAVITVEDPAVPEVGAGGEQFEFILQATDVLSLTFINPNEAIWGPGIAPITVEAHGSKFTPTTVVLWDGVAVPTVQISNTELHFTVDPTIEQAARTALVTVADGAAGLFDAQFYFRDARLAGYGKTQTGVVFVPARTLVQGLDLRTDGGLWAPPATHEHAGTIVEPRETGKQFARQRDPTTGIPDWVEVEGGMEEPPMEPAQTWGRSSGGVRGWLPLPDTSVEAGRGLSRTEDPATFHLDVATGATLGGVFVPGNQGLDLTPVGELKLASARPDMIGGLPEPPYDDAAPTRSFTRRWGEWVEAEPGGMEEPPADPVALWGRTSAGARGWEPIVHPPSMEEPPMEPVQTWGRSSGGVRGWLPLPDTAVEAGIGLRKTEEPDTIHLDVATANELGGVFVPGQQGLDLTQSGGLTLARATPEVIGGLLDAPRDDTGQKQYARKWGEWVETEPGGMEEPPMDPVAIWGRSSGGVRSWLEIPPGIEDVPPAPKDEMWVRSLGVWKQLPPIPRPTRPAGKIEAEIGVVFVPDRLGLAVGSDGQLALQPAEADQIGGLREVPGPGSWLRKQGAWEQYTAADAVTYGIGINLDGNVVNLQPATGGDQAGAPEIGGVYGTKRSERNGIEIDGYGHISAPLATELLAGTLLEPPPDDKGYVRRRDLNGVSQWVPPALPPDATKIWGIGIEETTPGTVDLQPANTNGEIGGVLVVGRSPLSGLEFDQATGSLWAPLATDILAGSIVEPPTDGQQYARSNDVMSGPVWVPTTSGGVVIADAPPTTPVPGGLWWDSDSGCTYLYYVDVDSSQWVQVASPSTGIEEAPINDTPHVRQNAMWLPTALTTTAGDVKSGFQTVDHGGWILLDGRAVTTLTVTQQDQAALLGFTANLPNAALCGLRQDSAAVPGVVGGSAKIVQANLPAINTANSAALNTGNSAVLTSGGFDAAAATSSSGLADTNAAVTTSTTGAVRGKTATGNSGYYFVDAQDTNCRSIAHTHTVDLPSHTHTVPAHAHSIPAHAHSLGGSGTDYYAKAMVVNFFLFLGA